MKLNSTLPSYNGVNSVASSAVWKSSFRATSCTSLSDPTRLIQRRKVAKKPKNLNLMDTSFHAAHSVPDFNQPAISSTRWWSLGFPLIVHVWGLVSEQEYVVKLSGLNKKAYQSSLKAMECMLGLQSGLGLRDLAVQYGCMEAIKPASQILQR